MDEKGNFVNFLNPKARLVTPDLKGSNLSLDQTGPGRYEATFDARQMGTYLINIRTEKGGQTRSQITGGVLPYSPEYAAIGTDKFLLTNLAERAKGDLLPLDKPGQIWTRPRTSARLPIDIWLPLLMLAACLFPLDVAVRRLLWGEDELDKIGQKLRNLKPRGPRAPKKREEKPRDERMEKLKKTKSATRGEVPVESKPIAPSPVAPSPPVEKAPPPKVEDESELDPMERLRRAKRRARGEE